MIVRRLLLRALLVVNTVPGLGAVGLGVSYFLPLPLDNGVFSHPVSPLSIRDVGVNFGDYVGVAGAVTLYNFNGLPARDTAAYLFGPAVGPLYTLVGSVVGKLMLPIRKLRLTAEGGVFGLLNLSTPLVTGAIDTYLAGGTYEAVTSSVTAQAGRWGGGFLTGGSVSYTFGQAALSLAVHYYNGASALDLTGTYSAYDQETGTWVQDVPIPDALRDATALFNGIEITVGVSYAL
jgi:hypothetical protein